MGEMVPMDDKPERDRALRKDEKVLGEINDAKRETKRLRAQAAIPALKALKDEIVRRAKTGELKEQLKGLKLSALLRDLGQIKQVLEDNMPAVVVLPQAPASAGKDLTHFRSRSAVRMSDKDREKRRRDAIEGETSGS